MIPLHVHSHYTLLSATPSIEALAQRAAAEGLTHLALTDTHALYGAVAFDRACRAVGVQPILGLTLNVAWPDDLPAPDAVPTPGQLVLLARDPAGYRALCALSSLVQGYADREARAARGLTLSDLRAHAAGLLALDAGQTGWAWRCLRAGQPTLARRWLARLAGLYDEHTYLGLELHRPTDTALAHTLRDLTARLGVPLVALPPVYCLTPEERPLLRLLAAIRLNCPLAAVPPTALPDGGDPAVSVHWLTAEEVAARYAEFPDAVARTATLAAQCGPALPDGCPIWPALDLSAGATPASALQTQAAAGLQTRYGSEPPVAARERLAHELTVITTQGYAPLFLIVADIVQHARTQDIPVSTRGSVANSLVAYCTGITTVDPLAHDLYFARFLNPARADAPDIDLDFCSRRRAEVLAYVRQRYGAERVALVGAVNTLQLRSAGRAVAKAYGLDEDMLATLLAALPRRFRPGQGAERTMEDVLAATPTALHDYLRLAYALEGFPAHLTVHPGGVVITPGPLTAVVPVQWAPKGFLSTQYPHGDVAALGLAKLDLLGIRALTVLADAAELVRRDGDPAFRLADIPLADPATQALLAAGDTVGIFQCESEGARRTLRKLQARTVRDLAVANAFFKPGPATGGLAEVFVRRYRGEAPVAYLHPALEPILAATQGVLLFQEQILRVATEIAGLSWAQADHLRRGMSKMQPGEMAQMQAAFEAGCQRPAPAGPGFTAAQARQLWEQVSVFAGYGFNQGHATAYADVSYRSAYLKAHSPAAFFAARLRDWGGYHHPAVYMAEAQRLGVSVRLPHVNHSGSAVTLAWEGAQPVLWLGLGDVRDLRRSAIAALGQTRAAGPFTGVRNLLGRVDLQAREVTHLIQGGALEGLGASRAALLAEAASIAQAGSVQQLGFDFGAAATVPETLAQRWQWEKDLVGYPWAALAAWLPELRTQTPGALAAGALPQRGGSLVTIVGARLPGWSREGAYLWDGATWWLVKWEPEIKPPPVWQPVIVRGLWQVDRWGMAWLQARKVAR